MDASAPPFEVLTPRQGTAAVLVLLALGLGLLLFPRPLFGYAMEHGNYRVRSDQPIDPAMASVLDDATRRLRTWELHDPRVTYAPALEENHEGTRTDTNAKT